MKNISQDLISVSFSSEDNKGGIFGHVSGRELFQVTVRHASVKSHVTLPISCRIFDGFNEGCAKSCPRYDNEISHLDDILWPLDRPLPYPAWGAVQSRLLIETQDRFNDLITALTDRARNQMKAHSYNTIGNFLTFYESYQQRAEVTESLESFYRQYVPPISDDHHTCVGLGMDLARRILELEDSYSGISLALFLASCEEDIGNVNRYVSTPTPDTCTSEKEHVVVALNINLEGRVGVLILDPGYHVAKPVVVMADGLYPHTGWFKPGGTKRSKRFYNYSLHPSGRYVLWDVKETRHGIEQCGESALIYTHQAFLSPVDCTERRNLVYNFKSLLKRDEEGNVIAGIYFALKPIDRGHFSLFYQNEQKEQVDFKISFVDVIHQANSSEIVELLRLCERKLGLTGLALLLTKTACALNNTEFMHQLLEINQKIVFLSENN